jgi:hypothetical protein
MVHDPNKILTLVYYNLLFNYFSWCKGIDYHEFMMGVFLIIIGSGNTDKRHET